MAPESNQHDSVEMPRPTAWPIVIALAIVLLALGVASSLAFSVVGGALLAISLVGWIFQLLPGRGHEHEALADSAERAKSIVARPGTVEQLKPGVVGHRFQLPEKVHPISAGVKGGILGGMLMPIPAIGWSIWAGHGPWFPINLLAGLVLPGLDQFAPDQIVAQLEAFHLGPFIGAAVMHVILSLGFGLVGGVLLPTLPPIPGGPLLFGGFILPLLWSGANYGLMGIINPLLNQFIEWRWYIVSQLIYGITTSLVIMSSEKIPIAPRGSNGDAGGPSVPPGWIGCLAAICILFSGCNDQLPGKPNPADAYQMPQAINQFAPLYAERCAGCHGADGKLGPGPPLNDTLFLALVSDDELRNVIADGRTGTLMPAFAQKSGGPLTVKQVTALVDGIKHEWKAVKSIDLLKNAPPLTPSARDASTSGNVAGLKTYAAACAGCHGKNGEGGDMAGPLHDRAFLQLMSDQVLRRYIITGRTDLTNSMPNFAGTDGRDSSFQPLTSQQVSDLVALLATWRQIDGSLPIRSK